MFKKLILLSLFITLAFFQGIYEIPMSGFPQYGLPSGSDNFPDSIERQIDVWVNIARVAPLNYRSDFLTPLVSDSTVGNVYGTSAYSSQLPYYWNLNLNRAARAHSFDISVNCPTMLQHTDCNGTTTGARLNKFGTSFSRSGWSGENFVNQFQLGSSSCNNYRFWPLISVGAFVCDGTYSSSCRLAGCKIDGVGDGHRAIIMSPTSKQMGSGNIWKNGLGIQTHDFSAALTPYNNTPLITTGSHIWYSTANVSLYRYVALVNTLGLSLQKVQVVVNGKAETLTYYAGRNTTAGIYQSTSKTFSSNCDGYYFLLSYNGTYQYRYPQSGQYQITDNVTCNTNWENRNVPISSFAGFLSFSTYLLFFLFFVFLF
eukprot:TRINITY_DN355_c0_g1_i1.p1 TRINITY_DN355_c0_g1~~TRINITY_DN355_c0_g1_i1.p1  ORF type:complete len:371 (-),score=80.28 TRINITY_DN355_c0_g1_i1:42-1154(-)